ncbi:type II secretion system (T2SS) protein F, partial [Ochrobactrum sp. BH3]
RRLERFLQGFPVAIDVIVRAVRSGLPLSDGIALIAAESDEPICTEFRRIVDAQQIGFSIAEAVQTLVQRIPCPEANFFAIVFQVQSQAGGNISDALGNLANVLRERKRTKDKARAMAAEAKASAWIIGSLPPIVSLLVYLVSPDYMSVLFTTSAGNILVASAAAWMVAGIFIMSKMINFKV